MSILRLSVSAALLSAALSTPLVAEPSHGIAMYGAPAEPADFTHLRYANPDAPKGGAFIWGEPGSFDSLNPFIVKGSAPHVVKAYVFESLMGRSYDEPFTLYGLLAESVETADDRSWVEFTLRPEAKFSDGSPVTVEDVMWSYETLGTQGHPRYRGAWSKVEKMEQTGERSVRFTFNVADRELALLMGMRPILKKAQWEADGADITESGFGVVPIGSSPYVIGAYVPGRKITLTRNPEYWGKDVPYMQGLANFDEITHEYFADSDIIFEAFKAGDINVFREANAEKWASRYDFPAVRSGEIVKSEVPHERPSGIEGLAMNTRREVFEDWRVREAMIQAFNYDQINQTLNGGALPRIGSYFSNSVLGMDHGPAEGLVREKLEAFDDLPQGALEGYSLPEGDASGRNRASLRAAIGLMEEAGYTVQDGVMTGADGKPFTFDILLNAGAGEPQQIVDIYVRGLERLGITPTVTAVDSAQFTERTEAFDFDMTYYRRFMSLSPGNEQLHYWGSEAAKTPGSRNWMGVRSAAVDGLIAGMVESISSEDYMANVKALDRVLTTGRYVIPVWYNPEGKLAHSADLTFPETIPAYGDWTGFLPEIWWSKSAGE